MPKILGFEIDIFVNQQGSVTMSQPDPMGDEAHMVLIGRGQLAEVIEELTRLKDSDEQWHVVEEAEPQ